MNKINFVIVIDRFDYASGLNHCMHHLAYRLNLLGENVYTFGNGKPGFQYKTLNISNWNHSFSNFVYHWNNDTKILNNFDKDKTIFIICATGLGKLHDEFKNMGKICQWILRPGAIDRPNDDDSIIVYMNEACNVSNTRCDCIMMTNNFDLHFWNEGDKKRNKNCYLTKRLNLETDSNFIEYNLNKLQGLSIHKNLVHIDKILPFAGGWDFDQKSKYLIKPIFQESEYFLSFEKYTALNQFAALCGCKVIVLDKNSEFSKDIEELPECNKGLAFGFDNLQHALNTRHLLRDQLKQIEKSQRDQVKNFINLCYNKLNIQKY